ncbi:transcription factor RcaD [Desertifilum sp. FACHB-1129]|uniref:Transcription factor RcaD n=2 Tax=Desertifilum tharense IPPAS B-1220 TaxID=1781255 RepID=A0A1E5QQV8_9CYAN|nr:transcription factor RcaD [Desertifilum tharense]MBD2312253.1 transcription factor RcaD [Desertifilum sp. FACHB-1129]MBD2323680.1 transcription factor RcaD [Desertifilum sp. FACHB-866]MBD2332377.1 transcription factor RcaD [Desertifilum sp. FACHB-868]MDA0210767.1 transcription factor RcaD [Cyanobacteria bacterium FC1]OEJ77065.1 transcription factor RcaD [Desertifilum tharense IPPAS B-1220]
MNTQEIKFLLKLLGFPEYRALLKEFDSFKRDRNKICQSLNNSGWLDYSREIASVKLLPPGRALLKLEPGQSPLTPNELKVVEQLAKASARVKPSQIKQPKAVERDAILQRFQERGLIDVETQVKVQKAEVWITPEGLDYLRDEFIPQAGNNPAISLTLLGNYLRFLRKSTRATPPTPVSGSLPSDEDILQTIQNLDRTLGTGNYLPIFHLRQKLQPPLSREELDQALYRLEKNDQIELSSLVEASRYSQEQIQAGISQRTGCPLFFIQVVND